MRRALMVSNRTEYLECLYAIWRAGAVGGAASRRLSAWRRRERP